MPSLAPLPKFRFFTAGSSGQPVRPLVGGKVYFYEAGTTTPKDTYTDSNGLVANTNPVILNARGEADIWLGDGAYKVLVTDADDVAQGGAVDNIKGLDQLVAELEAGLAAAVATLRADLANTSDAAKGAGQVGFLYSLGYPAKTLGAALQDDGIGATWAMTEAQRDDVLGGTYGIDVSSVLTQACTDARTPEPVRRVVLPAGGYSVTGFSGVPYAAAAEGKGPAAISGHGQRATILKARSGASTVLDARNLSLLKLDDFWIDCNSIAATAINTDWDVSAGPALKSQYVGLRISGHTGTAWKAKNNNDTVWHHVDIVGSTGASQQTAIDLDGPGGNAIFEYCSFLDGGYLDIGLQRADLFACVTQGIRMHYSGLNSLNVDGGYHYIPHKSGSNRTLIEIESGRQCNGLYLDGWLDTIGAGDTIIGGAGTLLHRAEVKGTIQPRAGASGAVRALGASLANGSGSLRTQVIFRVQSDIDVDWTHDRSKFHLVTDECLVLGFRVPDTALPLGPGMTASGAPYQGYRARNKPGSAVRIFGSATFAAPLAVGDVIATMPTGQSPSVAKIIPGATTNGYINLEVDTSGQIKIANAVGGTGFVSFDAIIELES